MFDVKCVFLLKFVWIMFIEKIINKIDIGILWV